MPALVSFVSHGTTLTGPSPMTLSQRSSSSPSPRFAGLCTQRISVNAPFLHFKQSCSPKGLGSSSLKTVQRQLIVSFAASHEESEHSNIEVEKVKNEFEKQAEESQEVWKQTLESVKEQAMKVQGISQEAYEIYSKKAVVIMKETSEKLKIQAEKAGKDLGIIADEINVEGKQYLSSVVEKSPESVKDIVRTFSSSSTDIKEISEVRDFYLGIPYGLLLSVGGFLNFMLTGSIPAVRFGIVLGGALLALSIMSLRAWNNEESSMPYLKGQAAITLVIFTREMRLLCQRPSFPTSYTTLVSGTMLVFYLYRILLNSNKDPSSQPRSKS